MWHRKRAIRFASRIFQLSTKLHTRSSILVCRIDLVTLKLKRTLFCRWHLCRRWNVHGNRSARLNTERNFHARGEKIMKNRVLRRVSSRLALDSANAARKAIKSKIERKQRKCSTPSNPSQGDDFCCFAIFKARKYNFSSSAALFTFNFCLLHGFPLASCSFSFCRARSGGKIFRIAAHSPVSDAVFN